MDALCEQFPSDARVRKRLCPHWTAHVLVFSVKEVPTDIGSSASLINLDMDIILWCSPILPFLSPRGMWQCGIHLPTEIAFQGPGLHILEWKVIKLNLYEQLSNPEFFRTRTPGMRLLKWWAAHKFFQETNLVSRSWKGRKKLELISAPAYVCPTSIFIPVNNRCVWNPCLPLNPWSALGKPSWGTNKSWLISTVSSVCVNMCCTYWRFEVPYNVCELGLPQDMDILSIIISL